MEGVIYRNMLNFFEADGWHPSPIEGKPVLKMGFQGSTGTWPCFAQAHEGFEQMAFYSRWTDGCPEPHRDAMAELMNRINYGLLYGNFELDRSDGEIGFRTSIDVEGDRLSMDLCKRVAYNNVQAFDAYLPCLLGLMNEGLTVEQALERKQV